MQYNPERKPKRLKREVTLGEEFEIDGYRVRITRPKRKGQHKHVVTAIRQIKVDKPD